MRALRCGGPKIVDLLSARTLNCERGAQQVCTVFHSRLPFGDNATTHIVRARQCMLCNVRDFRCVCTNEQHPRNMALRSLGLSPDTGTRMGTSYITCSMLCLRGEPVLRVAEYGT